MPKKCEQILKELESEGKIKVWWGYTFPEEIELTKKLKDILEKDVDEKYYLPDKLIAGLIANTEHQKTKGNGFAFRPGDRTPGIPTEQRLEINKQGISNTITTVQKDNYVIEPCLKIKEATKTGYKEAYAGDGVNISGRMKYQRGNVQKEMTQTLMTTGSERGVVTPDMRIRKLTPRECWRLMKFSDDDFDKAQAVPTSNTQLYKQARKLNLCKCTRSGVQELI